MQTGLVMGQTGYLQLPSSNTHIWRIPVASIAEEGQESSSSGDEDDEDEQGNDSEYTMIFIWLTMTMACIAMNMDDEENVQEEVVTATAHRGHGELYSFKYEELHMPMIPSEYNSSGDEGYIKSCIVFLFTHYVLDSGPEPSHASQNQEQLSIEAIDNEGEWGKAHVSYQ